MIKIPASLRNDLRRALDNFKYEMGHAGLFVPAANAMFNGVFSHRRTDGDEVGILHIEPNTWSFEGLDDILKVYFKGFSQPTVFNVAPFSGDVTPQQTWTGANFKDNATEFTDYSESTRVPWAADAEASQTVQNAATPSRFTISAGPSDIYGAGLIHDAAAKLATGGKLVAAARFDFAQLNLTSTSKLDIEYTITAQDAG